MHCLEVVQHAFRESSIDSYQTLLTKYNKFIHAHGLFEEQIFSSDNVLPLKARIFWFSNEKCFFDSTINSIC